MDWFSSHVPAGYLWCLCTVLTVVKASCPDKAMEKAMACTAHLGLGPSPSSPSNPPHAFVEKGQMDQAVRACRDNSFSDAVSCLERVTEACQGNSDQEHFLRNMVDAQNAREFVTFFCSHLNEYEEDAPCIGRMHSTLTQCVHQQRSSMQTKVKASSNMDFLMTSACKYFQAAETCSGRVLSTSCSASAADMVGRVFKAFKPPICHTVPYSNDRQAQSDDPDDLDPDPSSDAAAPMSRSRSAEVTRLLVVGLVFRFLVLG